MTKKWIKNAIVIILIVVIIVSGTFTYQHFSKAGKNATTTTFSMVTVAKGNINQAVTGSGTVSSGAQYTLTAANAGTIDSLPVQLGDTLKSGSTVLHINETDSADQVSDSETALQSAKESLTQAKENIDSVYVKAPIAGRIKEITVQSGDNLGTMRAVNDGILCTISTDGKMKLSITAQALQVGDKVTVKYKSTSVTGTVTSIGSSSNNESKSGIGGNGGSDNSQGSVTIVINRDDWPVDGTVTVLSTDGTVLGTATLAINSPVSIQASDSGTVKQVLCSENKKVSKNTKLFKLDDSSVQNQIQKMEQQVETAEKQLAKAKENASKDTVVTPINGVLSELNVKNGDSVTAGMDLGTVVDPSKMQVVVSVDELDITKVKVGQDADIAIDALSDNKYTGKVTQIDSIGTASNGVTTYNVTVAIDNATDVKVGMNATATIVIQGKQNVLTVPASAVQNIEGTTGEVLIAKDYFDANGKTITLKNADINSLLTKNGKEVRLGFKNENTIEIISGLSEGDKIAVPRIISQAMIDSLNNTSTTNRMQNSFGGMGGMGGLSGLSGSGGGGFIRREGNVGSTNNGGNNNNNRNSGSSRTNNQSPGTGGN